MIAAMILLTASLVGSPLAPVPFTSISHSEDSGVEQARQVVVRTAEEWKALWKEHSPGRPLPAVDFTKSMVVGVFLGSRSTSGHGVTISGVEKDGATVTVTYKEERPGPRDIVAQVITFPHHLVRVDRADGEVKFVRAER